MPTTIAITGKGGVGKSTIAALVIRWLNDRGHHSILAVDADSNVNLHDLLGVEMAEPIGTIREEMREKISGLPGGMSKQQFFEYKVHAGLRETKGFDLLAMGRPEGPGCYCYANNLLRDILKTIADQYEYMVIDNEAGMEHLSRRTMQHIDYLLIVSDATVRGIQTAGRISRLLKELDTRVSKKFLLINRVNGELSPEVIAQAEKESLELFKVFPDDPLVKEFDAAGKPTFNINNNSILYKSVDEMMRILVIQ